MTDELIPIVRAAVPDELGGAIGNSLADVWQALVGDRISSFRMKNAAKLSARLQKRLKEEGSSINWSRIPERYAVSWFEHATDEDEPSIQELFAKLLENAADGSSDARERRNIELVARLSASDAALLLLIYEEYANKYDGHETGMVWLTDWPNFISLSQRSNPSIQSISYENLQNLGIIEVETVSSLSQSKLDRWFKGKLGQDGGGFYTEYPVEDAVETSDEVLLTETGVSLLRGLF